ncbi:tRNA (adenosine(37)-N6)-threonylcarbamoyltransferase complex dimerization subunit type 1 TsaB [Metamycoplasma neophronis]|uniref:tRNA (Adenosine(37)-N6)-threonylcarbamoyltransferase complex dimerization subunit type 1 TsaB n=1 Tax=Metamycoplasma neophronis TaxID=872983 RepID=A0ABY2Z143_9BACT|nr:tRNA (adenosine(37)-N6)-threonylcarbamoyltransferase complex dimerization subunit type 1 TsaB [Metamycoplasma neophronis]TPR54267.1 tRNA (adenosine(37)-N6)-threonylcarbamoyltransferase complex dimerization subunit type 1 TsaB [Metamycoplasma neophronis]
MKLFVETSLSDLYMALIDNHEIIAKVRVENLVKKTDAFYENLNQLLEDAKVSIDNVESIYTTLGPGSFSGARIGFLFAKTLAQISDRKLYVSPTYELFRWQKQLLSENNNKIRIKANRYNVYLIEFNPEFSCKLVDDDLAYDKFDYDLFEQNPIYFLNKFTKVENPLDVELLYLHEPQIGGEKC